MCLSVRATGVKSLEMINSKPKIGFFLQYIMEQFKVFGMCALRLGRSTQFYMSLFSRRGTN